MKVIGISESENNDFVDYVTSFFKNDIHETIMLNHRSTGIFHRESRNLYNTNELNGIIKDATIIIIAKNDTGINVTNSQNHFLTAFNELIQNQHVLYFDISELAGPSIDIELKENNAIFKSENKVRSRLFIPKYKETFSKTDGIINTGLYVKFIQLVNAIKSNELATYFPIDRFTCGIDPTRKFFGEEDGY